MGYIVQPPTVETTAGVGEPIQPEFVVECPESETVCSSTEILATADGEPFYSHNIGVDGGTIITATVGGPDLSDPETDFFVIDGDALVFTEPGTYELVWSAAGEQFAETVEIEQDVSVDDAEANCIGLQPNPVDVGEVAQAEYEIENLTDSSVTITHNVLVDGSVEETVVFDYSPGAVESFMSEIVFDDVGDYSVSIEIESVEL